MGCKTSKHRVEIQQNSSADIDTSEMTTTKKNDSSVVDNIETEHIECCCNCAFFTYYLLLLIPD